MRLLPAVPTLIVQESDAKSIKRVKDVAALFFTMRSPAQLTTTFPTQARPEVRRDIVSLEKAFKDSNGDGHLGEDKAGRAEVATSAVAASLLCK